MIQFSKPFMKGKELSYIEEAHSNGSLAGDGPFAKRCHDWL
jgi:dTDP-4-amino-4,6-dideoxygalactose transaminase